MKKLLILSTALLVFAACGGKDDTATNSDEGTPQDDQSAEERAKLFQEKRDKISEAVEIEVEAMATLDSSLCNQIEDQNSRETCNLNVLYAKVTATKDVTLCDVLSDPQLASTCRQSASTQE